MSRHSTLHGEKSYDFDTQLAIGKQGEDLVAQVLGSVLGVRLKEANRAGPLAGFDFTLPTIKIEVKTDRKAADTGNLFLEYAKEDGSAGGLAISTAHVYAVWIPGISKLYLLNMADIQAFLAEKWNKYRTFYVSSTNGHGWKVRGIAPPITHVMEEVRGFELEVTRKLALSLGSQIGSGGE